MRAAGLTLLLLVTAAAGPAFSMPYHDGDTVVITGIVTDTQGRPLPSTTVVLEGSRTGFNVRSLAREQHDAQRVSTKTDARGEYSLSWQWAAYYNHFELQVGDPYRRAGGGPTASGGASEGFLVVDRQDLTSRLRGGSPVVASVTVRDTTPLDTLRGFLAGLKTADQRALYDTMGRPEQIDRFVQPAGVEETWWYFAAGKSYRFRDGKQLDVTAFDPVVSF